mmetsp:Transcript_7678/g.18976  ORF Transcript_7678/g.18976 Transcript_7678/m.18976 type:complete len:380 (-) Transcript_7678:1169-2308(-)
MWNPQMRWVYVLFIAGTIYVLPLSEIVYFTSGLDDTPEPDNQENTAMFLVNIHENMNFLNVASQASLMVATTFCFWAWAHSFVFEGRNLRFSFYAPKIAALIIIAVFRFLLFYGPVIVVGEFPIASLCGLVSLVAVGDAGKVPKESWVFIAFSIFFEASVTAWVLYVLLYAGRWLKRGNYLRTRSIITSYNYFKKMVLEYLVVSSIILTIEASVQVNYRALVMEIRGVMLLVSEYGTPLLFQCYFTTMLVSAAYLYLPADTKRIFHYRERKSADDMLSEQYRFKVTEFMSADGKPIINQNHFSLATNVLLLNFSWLIYQHGDSYDVESARVKPEHYGVSTLFFHLLFLLFHNTGCFRWLTRVMRAVVDRCACGEHRNIK